MFPAQNLPQLLGQLADTDGTHHPPGPAFFSDSVAVGQLTRRRGPEPSGASMILIRSSGGGGCVLRALMPLLREQSEAVWIEQLTQV